ncbi:DUF3604 domain-containing protein [Parasphingorhabdus cellanae]|uniref:DUF3604 domain-containing protein n=1 Tax=Parasphingorhabdus cellanae TaxID=2806553 RepID=A0ABX7T5M4_9SPHN|nr:DUF3604 domain-containing protein [Parasphingorhabdus cellanae]QTD56875.1 DUF3604 domain-containing protein [Parasphingorhabdus cellanae]
MPIGENLPVWMLASVLVFTLASCQNPAADEQSTTDSGDRVAMTDVPERVFWGDLHVHSNLSFDSNSFGNQHLGPEDAYRFARGEEVVASGGKRAKLSRPLDFLMVADHAEYLGVLTALQDENEGLLSTPLGKRWNEYLSGGDGMGPIMDEYVAMVTGVQPVEVPDKSFNKSVWRHVIDLAEQFNSPGKFTAFAGYEWTSMPGGRNLHRVVVFKDGPEKTKETIPFSALDSDDPEDLWAYLAQYEQSTKGSVLAIAHNGNLSGGIMFDDQTLDGNPLTAEYAKTRSRWEPVYEVTQVKGDGEAHPLLSADDKFADFETWDETDISLTPKPDDPNRVREMLKGEYARSGLKKGLKYDDELGANPYQFGLIGSTDSHTALATADDNNFWGKFKDSEQSSTRLNSKMGGALWPNGKLTASGYTGVWARANTRAELFDAIQRREVYATTGPRITLRVFAGWSFGQDDLTAKNFAAKGYIEGVPMGGLLEKATGGKIPRFLIKALKDPESADLERVQIIKGWRQSDGTLRERIYDVVLADQTSGGAQLSAYWADPSFDANEGAFYYIRVLEAPSKRWTTYDAERYGLKLPPNVPRLNQERAYSSPIWYRPNS